MQVRTILSQNTTDVTSHRAFASLKEAFPTWEEVLGAPSGLHADQRLSVASPAWMYDMHHSRIPKSADCKQ